MCHRLPIFSIPFAQSWVSRISSSIWYSNIARCLHKYIQEEIEFLNISSLDTAYRYVVKVEQKFKQKKRDFRICESEARERCPQTTEQMDKTKAGKPKTTHQIYKQRTLDTATKSKKDMGKWCEFHKSSTHNTSECRAKQSLVAELKVSESDACFDSESEPNKGNDKGEADYRCRSQRHYFHHAKIQEGGTRRSRGGGASLPLPDVGNGLPTTVHCRHREPKEPHHRQRL